MKKFFSLLGSITIPFWPMWATMKCIMHLLFKSPLPDTHTSKAYWFTLGYIGIIQWYLAIACAITLIHFAFALLWVLFVAIVIWIIIEIAHRIK